MTSVEPDPMPDVPALEDRAATVLAEVPEWIWDGETLPVPVDEIADSCFGLLVREVGDLSAAPGAPELGDGETLSGLLYPARGEIWVNANEARTWPPRRRFTIGHELGHWVLHRSGQENLFCRSAAVQPHEHQLELEVQAPVARPRIEQEASIFSAALLMPAERVISEWERCGGELEQMCDLFHASQAAMGRRLRDVVGHGGT